MGTAIGVGRQVDSVSALLPGDLVPRGKVPKYMRARGGEGRVVGRTVEEDMAAKFAKHDCESRSWNHRDYQGRWYQRKRKGGSPGPV